MTRGKSSRLKIGARLDADLTVLGIVDDRGEEPVYLTWHQRFWCPMACKVFNSRTQAQREAKILQALGHPNIVRCFGLNGSYHLLMEFLEGSPLSRLIDSQPQKWLEISDALRTAIHIGAALTHIHERGLLHLDVKPSNVIVANRRPILFDFGIARWQTAARPKKVRGTDPYIAPEECLLQRVTAAADVFSLGVTLYELLTGHVPFPEETKDNPFPQVSQPPASLRQYRPTLPAQLEELILGCLGREPAARPKLAALLPALHAFITSGPAMWPGSFRPISK